MGRVSKREDGTADDAAVGNRLNRVGAAALIPQVLRDLGVNPAEVFHTANIDMDRFADPDSLVPLPDQARVVTLAVQACGRTDFGLLIADRARAQKAGLLGELFMSADDLRSALHTLIRYFHLNTRGGIAMLTVEDGVAEIQLAFAGPYGDAAVVFEDAIVGIFFHHVRAFLGESWHPFEVLLSHSSAPGAEGYRQFFGVPVRFDALCTAILFSADDLARPMIGRERKRHRLEAAAAVASSKLDIGFDEQVRWAIQRNLGRSKLTIDPIVRELGMSRRTLNRRLAERGLTFAHLLRLVRFAIARQLLEESDTPLAEIATAIGYGEASIFSNAFRSWSGVSPSGWRRLHGRGKDPIKKLT